MDTNTDHITPARTHMSMRRVITYHNVKVRVDFIEEELSQCEGSRLKVAGELVALTNVKLLQDKEGH